MATYTDNYQFTKPTYAEVADVQTFNNNMTKIDEILHASQVSLAPAYDPTETYNAGDVVMYELLMYECQEDGVTGVWDPTKWRRTTAGEHGGGSDVEPNPTGEPTATLNKLGIEGTIYGIEGSGGGNVYGAFIDTNRKIAELEYTNNANIPTYTAIVDCFVSIYLFGKANQDCSIEVDGAEVSKMYFSAEEVNTAHLFLKRGQTLDLSITQYHNLTLRFYGLTFGTQNIFTPQIYSTEERCVGVWIDNKPLYAKTCHAQNVTSSASVVDASFLEINYQLVGYETNRIKMGGAYDGAIFVPSSISSSATLRVYVNSEGLQCNIEGLGSGLYADDVYFTILYTKTTDTAGSGMYNSLGVPMVHYSPTEYVIGTAEDENGIIKPLYEKMTYIPSLPNATETEYSLGITNIKKVYYVKCIAETPTIALPLFYNAGNDNNSKIQMFVSDKLSGKIKINTFGDNRSGMSGTVIIRYTKTTD